MKKTVSITIALVLILSMVGLASAQQQRTTAFQIVNLGTDAAGANITIYYYNAMDFAGVNGAGMLECTDYVYDLAPFKSAQYNQAHVSGPYRSCIWQETTWKGSVVIESTEPIAVITNVTEPIVAPNVYYAGGSYGGLPDLRTNKVIVFPFIIHKYGGFNTDFAVQNAGGEDTTIQLDYYPTGSTTPVKSEPEVGDPAITIKPGASYYRDQGVDDTDLGQGWSGVVVVTSLNDQPLAGVVNEYKRPETGLPSQTLNYEGFAQGDSKLYMPFLCKEFAGFSTGFQVVAMADGTVGTLTFYPTGSATPQATTSLNLDKYEAYQCNLGNGNGCVYASGSIPSNWSGVGVVELSTGSAVAIVNENGTYAGNILGLTYSGSPATTALDSVAFPFVMRKYTSGQWWTAFQIVNVGGASGTVTVYYDGGLKADGVTYFPSYTWTSPGTLDPNEAMECNQKYGNKAATACIVNDLGGGQNGLPQPWMGSVRVVSNTPGMKLVGILNERGDAVPNDSGLVYNSFPYAATP